jgi:dihydrofolate reductase
MEETMRKVAAGLFISVDGVVEAPNEWQFDVFDEDMGAAMTAHLATEDSILLGRQTYQEWAGYWPTSTDEPYASHVNQTPKYVVSTTLKSVAWGQFDTVKLIRNNLAEEIRRLKQEPGKNIGVAGSPTLVKSLLEQDLLDSLILMVHPVVAGKGTRLFASEGEVKRLRLLESKITGSGVAILTYEPRRD